MKTHSWNYLPFPFPVRVHVFQMQHFFIHGQPEPQPRFSFSAWHCISRCMVIWYSKKYFKTYNHPELYQGNYQQRNNGQDHSISLEKLRKDRLRLACRRMIFLFSKSVTAGTVSSFHRCHGHHNCSCHNNRHCHHLHQNIRAISLYDNLTKVNRKWSQTRMVSGCPL